MLQLNPEDCKKAFDESEQFYFDKSYYDSTRIVRNYIVADAVLSHMPAEIGEEWKKYVHELCKTYKKVNITMKI